MRKESTSSEIPISYDISEKYKPERAGFEPAVQVFTRTTV
jgi:hypothetical protein